MRTSSKVESAIFHFKKCAVLWVPVYGYPNLLAKSKDSVWNVYFPAGPPSTATVVEVSPVPMTPEELKKQELAIKIKQEYFSALKHEGMLLFGYLYWGVIVIPNFGSVIVKTSQKLWGKWMDK